MNKNKKKIKNIDIRKELNKLKLNIDRNEEHEAILKVKIDNIEDVISPYSLTSKPLITNDLAEILENQYLEISIEKRIEILVENLKEEDAIILEDAKRNYYLANIVSKHADLKHNTMAAIALLAMGIILFIVMAVLKYLSILKDGSILYDVIDIASTVFIWESVTIFFIERRSIQFDLLKYIKLSQAKIKTMKNGQ